MHPLLLQLDLDRPGLEEANALARASRIHEALASVVRYFRTRPEPDPSLLARPNPGAVEACEKAIAREFVFYQVPAKVPPGNWDWTWRPGTDWEWTYALNRHHWWAELAAAFLATGDQRYAEELDSLIRSWVGQCPVHVDDISSWRTLETGLRVAGPWMAILAAMKATPLITDTAWIMYLRAIHDHAEHLVAHPKANNWLLVESNGLLTCGIVFPEFRHAKEWVRTAVERFEREMEQSVHPDGAHIEYSSSYHFLSLHSFTAAMDKADRTVGSVFSDAFRNRLELMWEYPMYMMRPDGRLPLLNDSDTADIRPQLRAAGERFRRPTAGKALLLLIRAIDSRGCAAPSCGAGGTNTHSTGSSKLRHVARDMSTKMRSHSKSWRTASRLSAPWDGIRTIRCRFADISSAVRHTTP